MSRLEIKVDGDDVEATKMLSMATASVKLLKSIERAYCKEKGIKTRIRWFVDMQSGFSFGLIALRAEPAKGVDAKDARYTEELATLLQRIRATQ